jgi:UDP-N-acetylmuramoyl-tripeptide--D-alanyl-D-alanine ligase
MSPFTVRDLVRGTQGALVGGDLAIPVTGVGIDSRTLQVGEAFFAIRGPRFDGHAFLPEAAARGAAAVVVDGLPDEIPLGVPLVLVDDTTRALGRMATFHRRRFAIPVVAVTGSNGKTTTKEMIAAVLGRLGPVLKPEGSLNNQWGLPLTLLRLGPAHEAAALELGTSAPGEIAALAALCLPTVGVVTTVSPAHTELLGDLEGVQTEKGALVRAIPPEGRVVLNADDPRVLAMREWSRAPVVTYGARGAAEVRAEGEAEETAEGIRFTLGLGGARARVLLRFAGAHNVANALAAAAVGGLLGLPLGEIVAGLESARPPKGRCVWRRAGQARILDDTYNANPASVQAALRALLAAPAPRRIVVLGDMLELGESGPEAHREVGRAVAALGVAEFLATGPLAALAVEAARERGLAESHHLPSWEDVVARLQKRLAPGDAVLVKGSRRMGMERVVDALVARLGGGG